MAHPKPDPASPFMEFIRAWYSHSSPHGEWRHSHIHKIRMTPADVAEYKSIAGSNVVEFKLESGSVNAVWITLEEFEEKMGF